MPSASPRVCQEALSYVSSEQQSHWDWRRPPLALTLAWVALTALCGALYLRVPPSPDQAIFDYIGWVGAQGGTYYVDVAEQNWPGKMFMHELAIRVSGVHVWTFRAFDYLCMFLGLWAMLDLLRPRASVLTLRLLAFIYPAMYASGGYWLSGQRDIVAAHLLFLSAALFARRLRGGGSPLALGTGAAIGAALMVRPTYLAFAVALLLVDFLFRSSTGRGFKLRLVDGAWAVAGGLAVVLGVVLWGHLSGALDDWFEQAILMNVQGYQDSTSRLGTAVRVAGMLAAVWHWYFAFACLGFGAAAIQRRLGIGEALTLCVMGVGALSAIVQNKGFGYHYAAFLPGFAIGIALWLAFVFERWLDKRGEPLRAVLALACALVAVGGLAKKAHGIYLESETLDDRADAARFAREHTEPDDRILVWTRSVGIYMLAERRATTRFTTIGMLLHAVPPFDAAGAWHAEFARELRQHPPALVYVRADFLTKPPDGEASTRVVSLLTSGYEPVATFGEEVAFAPVGRVTP